MSNVNDLWVKEKLKLLENMKKQRDLLTIAITKIESELKEMGKD